MTDPNQQRQEGGESSLEMVGEAGEIGAEIASEGIDDMALDGVSAAAEIAGDLVGGILTSID